MSTRNHQCGGAEMPLAYVQTAGSGTLRSPTGAVPTSAASPGATAMRLQVGSTMPLAIMRSAVLLGTKKYSPSRVSTGEGLHQSIR
ncbi:MAG: hypothetical protein AB9M53_02460 [Leptothrix sp. (in: b-proteobacteria)]